MKPKVIISTQLRSRIREALGKLLSDVAEVRFLTDWTSSDSLKEIRDAEALIPLHEYVDEKLLSHASKLKVVSRFGVGYDRIDVEACTKRGIYVTHTPGVLSRAVAELTFALMLCLSRRILEADRYVRREWAKAGRATLPLREDLAGKTLGIIGLGRIGTEVARRGKAFEMKIIYYDKVRRYDVERDLEAEYVSFDELLKTSDFVSIHVPLTPETTSLIGEKELKKMKKTAYIINTSRGPVIDEKALCRALEEKWIAGAGLDVFAEEPLPSDSPLIRMKNVVLTPHMATHTIETRRLMMHTVVEDVRRVLAGKAPLNPVPEQKGKIFTKAAEAAE